MSPLISTVRQILSPNKPRHLLVRLVMVNLLILGSCVMGFSWYLAFNQNNIRQQDQMQHYWDLLNLVQQTSHQYLQNDLPQLRLSLNYYVHFPGVLAIQVKDGDGHTAIDLFSGEGSRQALTLQQISWVQLHPAQNRKRVRHDSAGVVELSRTLDLGDQRGQLRLLVSDRNFKSVSLESVKLAITVSLVALILVLFANRKLLQEPLHAIRRASEFIQWLDMGQGNFLEMQTKSAEVEQLVNAVNQASRKLYQASDKRKDVELLNQAITDILKFYLTSNDVQELYHHILNKVITLTQSEFGFVGDVFYTDKSRPYLKIQRFSNLTLNLSQQEFMKRYAPADQEFHNLNTLIGAAIQTGKPVLSNDVVHDPRSGGMPPGHPPVMSYMGLPLIHEGKLLSVIGVANRRGGYNQDVVSQLQPLLDSCAGIIVALRNDMFSDKVQQQLIEKEARLRTILNTVSDAVITFNEGGFVENINPAGEQMFACLYEDLMGKNISALVPDLMSMLGSDGTEKNLEQEWESSAYRNDKTVFPVALTVNRFNLGVENLYTVTVRDVSQQKQIEALLRHNEHTLIKAQEMVHLGSWELEIDSGKLQMTNEVKAIFQLPSEQVELEIKLETLLGKIHQDDRDFIRRKFEKAISSKKGFANDARLDVRSEEPVYIHLQGQYLLDTDTGEGLLVGSVQDITQIKRLMRAKDEFITSVSEKIRSPLSMIRGSIGMLSTEVGHPISNQEKDLLDSAYRNTDKLLLLFNDILDIEHIESGKSKFDTDVFELDALFADLVYVAKQYEERFGNRFVIQENLQSIVISGDRYRVLQVLNNLVSNAAKFSPAGSIIKISCDVNDDNLRIRIQDQGPGLPENMEHSLFNRYLRDWSETGEEGTGLGLCLSRSIMERLGGRIGYQSKLGQGSCFYIDLPIPQQNVTLLKRF